MEELFDKVQRTIGLREHLQTNWPDEYALLVNIPSFMSTHEALIEAFGKAKVEYAALKGIQS